MINVSIPTTVVDHFFEDPLSVRRLALEQEFLPSNSGRWPGRRTKTVDQINYDLYHQTVLKLLNLFFHPDSHTSFVIPIESYSCNMFFQLVDADYNQGWVHCDEGLVTGIVYLNPDTDHNSGTSIYRPNFQGATIKNFDKKLQNNLDKSNDDVFLKENNKNFRESIIVKNEFNRLIAFDSHLPHAAGNFFGHSNTESRLTLVFFLNFNSFISSPIIRMRKVI